jgi:hypothetical protein
MKDLEITPEASTGGTGGLPGWIKEQEARRQEDLMRLRDRLPIDGIGGAREVLERCGFKLHDAIDDLFVSVTFAPGWELRPTDNSLWTNLVDEKGRHRGMVFWAPYEHRASIFLDCRYRCQLRWARGVPELGDVLCAVSDCDGSVLYNAGSFPSSERDPLERASALCEKWLDEHFPNWRDPAAYWDEPVEGALDAREVTS